MVRTATPHFFSNGLRVADSLTGWLEMGVAAIQAGTAPDALLGDLDQTLIPSVKGLNGHPFGA
jgi:hypothetical protein